MSDKRYAACYARFDTPDKRSAAVFLGPDNLVGDPYEIVFADEDGVTRAWAKNRFGKQVAFFDEETTGRLRLWIAKGMKVKAFLSFVAFTEEPAPGLYWGEMALIAYDPSISEVMETFEAVLSKKMGDGVRPQLDFGSHALDQLINSGGTWFPKDRVPLPPREKGTAIVKDHRTPNERLIEQSRKGNRGCYFASWAFLLALVALIIFGLHSCGVF